MAIITQPQGDQNDEGIVPAFPKNRDNKSGFYEIVLLA
jgi:hypothetical protein